IPTSASPNLTRPSFAKSTQRAPPSKNSGFAAPSRKPCGFPLGFSIWGPYWHLAARYVPRKAVKSRIPRCVLRILKATLHPIAERNEACEVNAVNETEREKTVSPVLEENMAAMRAILHADKNKDFVAREFVCLEASACAMFVEGM